LLEFTDWAVQILRRSHEAARRFNPKATVRVFRKGAGVEFALVEEPQPGDQVVERDGFTVYVQTGVEGTIDVVEPHDQLVLRTDDERDRHDEPTG
jgi:Fe-S cluster assembly iron-binding protein IscA